MNINIPSFLLGCLFVFIIDSLILGKMILKLENEIRRVEERFSNNVS